MVNIIFNGFIHPIIGICLGLLLIAGTENLGRLILNKINIKFFFINLSVGVIVVSCISYIFILLQLSKYINHCLGYILVVLGIYNIFFYLKKKNLIIIDVKKNKICFYIIFLYLFFLFFISISAPSMADALDYHLGVPNYIYNNNKLPNQYHFSHVSLIGLGEIYNYLGLIVYSDIVGSLLQFVALISFLNYFSHVIRDQERYVIFILFIIGSPVLIYFISGSKYNLFPQLITTYVLFLLIQFKRVDFKMSLLIFFLLFGAMNFKLNFLLTGSLLALILLTKCKIEKKLIFYVILLIIFLFLPKIIYNYFSVENFTYINFLIPVNESLLNYIRSYKDSDILFPFDLFLIDSVGKITTILGFSFLILIFIKKINIKNNQIFLITLIGSILYFFLSQKTGRIYYEFLLWLSLIFFFSKSYKIKTEYIKIFLLLNLIIPFIVALVGFYNLSPSIFNNNYRKDTMRANSSEFKAIEWMNQRIPSDTIILSNFRSKALLNNQNIELLTNTFLADINYKNFIMNSKIDYIVIKNFDNSIKYFFNNCKFSFIAQSPDFLVEKRNFLNRDSFYSVSIFKLTNRSLENCIKN
jgi:hypothetical protein